MKQVLQHVKDALEQSFDDPKAHDLDHCIKELEQAKAAAGDKAAMLEDVIRAVTHAKHAQVQLENAEDLSATNAFGGAYRAIDQAIEAFSDHNNDPF
ncbi:hypothetical protein ACFOU2_20190 [Bacillus songklensis]|uniref:Uncharacterized protein n=1 Tax=Bacillus songklensis TaxID=1069116 RepID=A0ABV8B8Y4_9BACI